MKHTLKPHITEKSYSGISEDKASASTYTFRVSFDLDKATVKSIVEKQHKVTVEDVRIVNLPGKARRFKGIAGRTSAVKKAIVRLKKGDRIAAFDIETKDATDKE